MSEQNQEKQKRECGICHGRDHNRRTCPQRTEGNTLSTKPAKKKASRVKEVETSVSVAAPTPKPPVVVGPYEEATRQLSAGSKLLSCRLRHYDQGAVEVGVVIHDTTVNTLTEIPDLNYEEAVKLYESLGWALQMHAAKSFKPTAKPPITRVPVRPPAESQPNGTAKSHEEAYPT